MNMAVTGANGDNETNIGLSKSISYSLYDENKNEILVKDQKKPIEYWIPKDATVAIEPFKYIEAVREGNENSSNTSFINGYYMNGFRLKGNNVSVHVQIKPLNNTSLGYLFLLKFGDNPKATSRLFDEWKMFCPSGNIVFRNRRGLFNYLFRFHH